MKQLTLPYWFSMRQGKAEPAGDNAYRLTAPNLPETFISLKSTDDKHWVPVLRGSADGPEIAAGERPYDNPTDGWYAAFELYRNQYVV